MEVNLKYRWRRLFLVVSGLLLLFLALGALTPFPRSVNKFCRQLSPEKCAEAGDQLNFARRLYLQGKYEACLGELDKLHAVTALYENSTELQIFCQQGRELGVRQLAASRKPATK